MLRFRVIFYAIAAAFMAAPARVLAATPSEKDTPLNLGGGDDKSSDAASHTTGGGSIVRTIVGLAIVVGIIFALHWILKQAKASKEGKASGAGLAPIATLPMGNGRSVQLLRAGTELVLVGVGEQGITPIRRYSEDEARELGLLPDEDDESDSVVAGPGGAVAGLFARFQGVQRPAAAEDAPQERRPGWQGVVDQLRQLTVMR